MELSEEIPIATETASGTQSADGPLSEEVARVLRNFTDWLTRYGETSWDHQSFFAGPVGRRAKLLYYNSRFIGTATVSPMIFCEAFLPSARRLFHHRIRLPIADAHYAMGLAFLFQTSGDARHFQRAVHFLDVLKATRCSAFSDYCWGYPFDWVTRGGVIKRETPLITSTPYAYDAFLQLYQLEPRKEWQEVLSSIARHVARDIKSFKTSERGSSSSYTPFDNGGVVNAAAYRAALLTSAAGLFGNAEYSDSAERNLNFVLEAQNADGSWLYAADQSRRFVDHFHTCFVMKALAKIHAVRARPAIDEALRKAVHYYLENLFYEDGMPKPFSVAPRLTVYKCELYDCAECINVCLLLRNCFPTLARVLETVVLNVVNHWVKRDGSFRSRQLRFGWDDVPMHRWGQSQMFRSLALYLLKEGEQKQNA